VSKKDRSYRGPVWAIRAIAGTIVLIILVLAFLLPETVTLLILGSLVAYLLDPLVQIIERRGTSRMLATTAVFIVLSLVVFAGLVVLVPAVASQFDELRALDVTRASEYFASANSNVTDWFEHLGIHEIDALGSLMTYLGDRVPDVIGILPDALSFLGSLALFPFIVFFLLKDGRALKKSVLSLVPNRYFEFSLGLIFKMDLQLGNYLRGQLIEALVVGVLSIAALWALDIPYFLPVGIFAGAANIVPYLGPSAGAVTAVTVVLLGGGSVGTALLVVVLFMGIQLIDNGVVQPLVISRNVRMHPLVIVVSVVAGGQLFGFLGLLLAVPAVAVVKVFVVESIAILKRYQYGTV
jgi:putative permease